MLRLYEDLRLRVKLDEDLPGLSGKCSNKEDLGLSGKCFDKTKACYERFRKEDPGLRQVLRQDEDLA